MEKLSLSGRLGITLRLIIVSIWGYCAVSGLSGCTRPVVDRNFDSTSLYILADSAKNSCLEQQRSTTVPLRIIKKWYDKEKTKLAEMYPVLTTDSERIHGLYQSYYADGALMEEACFNNGAADGIMVSYFKNGKISSIGNMHLGKAQGMYHFYCENGALQKTVEYNSGRLWSILGMYDSASRELSFGNLNNGEGIVSYYRPDGALFEQGEYRSGLRHGRWLYIHDNGDSSYGFFEEGYLMVNGERTIKAP